MKILRPGHEAMHGMPRCRGTPELVREALHSFPRVLGIGLPHTGTTTLHDLLLTLGCCFASHNHPMGFGSVESQRLQRLCTTNGSSATCTAALLQEIESWQCVSDNPWAQHWRLLAENAPPRTRFVLTRFADPLQYGISRALAGMSERRVREGALLAWAPSSKLDGLIRGHARAYRQHVVAVRAALGSSQWFAEVCWVCGDNASDVIERLQLPSPAWDAASNSLARATRASRHQSSASAGQGLPELPAWKSSGAERHRVAKLLRERILTTGAACAPGDERTAWLCVP